MPQLGLSLGLTQPFISSSVAELYPQTLTISSAWWSTRDAESTPDNRTNISFARGQVLSENTSPFPVACDVMYTASFTTPLFVTQFVGFGLVTSTQIWTHWYGDINSEEGQLYFYSYPHYETTNTHASTSPTAFPTSNWTHQGASTITLNF